MSHRASSFFYETDAENRIVSLLEAGREGPKPHWYRYDAADRLLADDNRGWNDRRYSYDAADNRTSATSRQAKQTIVANALNQMQTVNGQPAQYDAAGNLLEDEARQYDWDAEHRLIRIRYKAQASKETRFGYDGLGRRTVITEVDGTGTTETHYIWCGEVICQKRDANGQLLRAYYPEGEYGPEIGKRVAKADAGIEADEDGGDQDAGKSDQPAETVGSIVYARNHLGSVTDTQTLNGRAVSHTEYGPYGEPIKSEGRSEYRSDFGYAGMQYHAASGMYLTQFRAYDPGTGRWVSRDPIGEEGGINLYTYVEGNPVSSADSLGLCPDCDKSRKLAWDYYSKLQAHFPTQYPKAPSAIFFGPLPADHGGMVSPLLPSVMILPQDFCELSDRNTFDFYWAIAHEGLHINQGWVDLVKTRGDTPAHDQIDQRGLDNTRAITGRQY
ncbi:hypothetical protein AB851_17255 [Ralstonia pseudosolanacearum]|nr:hypothetical protein AB851_17255 [Ralstonia pseudosolanacearum]